MSQIEILDIGGSYVAEEQSGWTDSRSGRTVISILGDWGGCTRLDFVYGVVDQPTVNVVGDEDDLIGAPSSATNQAFPVYASVAATDEELVFKIDPSDSIHKLAVIPYDNDTDTDLRIIFS